MERTRDGDETDLAPATLNRSAIFSLLVSVAVAVVGLFVLPALRSWLGLAFWPAFLTVLAVEFVAFIGVAVSVLRLHREPSVVVDSE
ncbi:hypothetical protein [Halosegnis sp.]|uniref:hypothetical protein n=1 Tax=Halosegnis sp. TaxID=2864959 RepID=UPI0035D4B325